MDVIAPDVVWPGISSEDYNIVTCATKEKRG